MTPQKKRILMFACIDASLGNACTLHIAGIANGFADLGHDITLILPATAPGKNHVLRLRDTVHLKFFNAPARLPNAFKIVFGLPALVREWNMGPDLFYTRFSLINALALGLARFWGLQSVSEHNGLIGEEIEMLGQSKFIRPVAHALQILDGWMARKVSAVTPGIKLRLAQSGVPSRKIFVSGNGTDTSLFTPMNRAQCLESFGLDANKNYIGFIGVLAQWQGVAYLVDAFALIVERFPGWDLLIAGAGPQMEELKQKSRAHGIENRVHFVGQIPVESAPIIINGFDIATSPALHQRNASIGVATVKIRDYAATGCAILAADLPGNSELQDAGILVCHTPENEGDIASHLAQLIEDGYLRHDLGKRAFDYAQKEFDWARYSAQALDEASKP